MKTYRGYKIVKNEFNYYEAYAPNNSSEYYLFSESESGIKEEIDDEIYETLTPKQQHQEDKKRFMHQAVFYSIIALILIFLSQTHTVKQLSTPMLFVYSICGLSFVIGLYFIIKYLKRFLMNLVNDWKA